MSKENALEFTQAELQNSTDGKLTDDQLDNVAGGWPKGKLSIYNSRCNQWSRVERITDSLLQKEYACGTCIHWYYVDSFFNDPYGNCSIKDPR